jgi:hypothetical protein
MGRVIATVSSSIPGHADWDAEFGSAVSILHADIVLFCPDISNYLVNQGLDSFQGKRILSEDSSATIQQHSSRWQQELSLLLDNGKTVFILMRALDEVNLYAGIHHATRLRATVNTVPYDNYRFLPVPVPKIVNSSTRAMVFCGNQTFATLWAEFGERMEPEAYFDGTVSGTFLSTKVGGKTIGAVLRRGTGHLVFMPPLGFDDEDLTYVRRGETYWKKSAVAMGERLVALLVDIDSSLRNEGGRTPAPAWVSTAAVKSPAQSRGEKRIAGIESALAKLGESHAKFTSEVKRESRLDALLYEKGKPLEVGVTLALQILGFTASGFDDGDMELDQIVLAPEGQRYIGECEGKDDAHINVEKFRQLQSNIQEDCERGDPSEPAVGILFGNGFRLRDPASRPAQFTEKCIRRAASTLTVLVTTPDLYRAASYARTSGNSEYAAACRRALFEARGRVVQFPDPPHENGDKGE